MNNAAVQTNEWQLYETMLKIRMTEEKIASLYWDNEMKTPVHLCIGQEAVAAGVCTSLRETDTVFSNHRGHGHYLAKGGDLQALVAELHNRETGCSKGRGGSMHIIDMSVGFHGTSAIVGGGVPVAAGAALSFKMQQTDSVSVAFFGDAAVEEGAIYESINIAALWRLPILFACENNLYAVGTTLAARQASPEIYKKFSGIPIKSLRLDGNDAVAIQETVSALVRDMRAGCGPVFVEFLTYRHKDHHATGTGVEAGYRTQAEWEGWVEQCPLARLEKKLLSSGVCQPADIIALRERIAGDIAAAFAFAEQSRFPKPEELMNGLYYQEV